MRRKKLSMKVAAAVLAAATFMSTCPTSALAVTGSQVAADGTYTKTVHVARTQQDDDEEQEWNEYDIAVSLTVKNGKFEDITVTPDSNYTSDNSSYFNKAVSKGMGFVTLLKGKEATEDTINSWNTVSGATRTSKAIKDAALEAIQSAKVSVNTSGLQLAIITAESLVESDYTADSWKELQDKLTVAKNVLAAGNDQNDIDTATSELNAAMDNLKGDFKYVYAALNWSEYWQNEGVLAAGSTESDKTPDLHGETDKGAYDTVTRATTNHGLHRGSFQCTATIHTKEGHSYAVSHWASDGKSFYTTDGTQIQWSKGKLTLADGSTETMENYDVSGIKYVPVKVKASDYAAFCEKYQVVENGGTLQGGYGEGSLKSYAETAEVTENTNGLKTATKNADGSFSFSKAVEGTDSGIKDATLKKAEKIEVNVRTNADGNKAPGNYGEFIRVDLTGDDYGDLGANMQSVEWTYYGNDSTYTNALQTYGTKFAADNWMHKSMGIQLGLTDSVRCQLPADTDGTGYWTFTVHALGYEDTTYQIQITDDNIAKVVEPTEADLTALNDAIAKAEALTQSDYTEKSWSDLQSELAEAKDEANWKRSQGLVQEATTHLNDAISNLEISYTYVYAALNWSEYWQNEGVQAAGSTETDKTPDLHGETDKGAYDTVTRATTNHGLHRGSFQCTATIHTKEGNSYALSHWASDGKSFYTTDGTQIQWSKGVLTLADGSTETMEYYDVSGIKYVPVKVKTSDYAAFAEKYQVVENGGTLQGGYGEGSLKSYVETAEVTENTNGLKTATKNADGSFSFSKAVEGTDSGIKDATLKKAEKIEVNVRTNADGNKAPGNYGEFIRVDLTGDDYGDLGANMQSVEWTYYGNDSTYTNALQTYGTKFAADNWMHKSMGIQLGLTDSVRCQLPADTDGTGYWTLTVHALGYEDTTYKIQITDDNIAKVVEPTEADLTALNDAIAKAEALADKENDYTTKSWSDLQSELAEAKDEANWKRSQGLVQEATTHLNDAIDKLVARIQLSKTTVAGVNYYYYKGDAPSADQEYSLVSKTRKGTTVTLYTADKFQKVGNSDVYYALDDGATDVKDMDVSKVYAYKISDSKKYSEIYKDLGVEAKTDDFDVITSATNYTSHHANDISTITASDIDSDGNVALTGKLAKESLTKEQVAEYVDAYLMSEAGEFVENDLLDNYRLAAGPAATVTPKVATAEYTTSKYGDGEFAITFDDTVDGYVWNEFWNNMYAATVSDGTTTTGAVHWVDLYGESATAGPHYNKVELALNNGTSKGANAATVKRFAAFYDEDGNVKAGDYTITLYSEGYTPVTATIRVKETNLDASALESAISKAEALKEADYTSDSWKAMSSALESAKAVLESAQAGDALQTEVDAQVEALNNAIAALVKKTTPTPTPNPTPAEKLSGLNQASDGNWYYYVDGKVASNYTGFAKNSVGEWYVEKGKVTFNTTKVVQDTTGVLGKKGDWYYVAGSYVQRVDTVAPNEYGWWKITNGKVDFTFNGLAANEYGWWKISGGAVDFNYNGLAANEYGWWKISGGAVDFTYNGLAANEYGWWKVTGGAVDFNYNGLAANEYGWWKISGGAVDFTFNGLCANENGWWKLTGGCIDFNYNGIEKNEYGWWKVTNGKVDFSYNGKVRSGLRRYNVVNGKVDKK